MEPITPEKQNYKPITPFKMFIKGYFPFIEDTMEAIDNYGLLCKVVEYLNNVITNENTMIDNINSLYNAFNSLQTNLLAEWNAEKEYIDNYFENLNVQNEINKKLDSMVADGTLQNLLNEQIQNAFNDINDRINALTGNVGGVYETYTDLVNADPSHNKIYIVTEDGNWYYYTNNTWTIGGVFQSTSIANGSIDILKLDNKLQSNFNCDYSEYLDLSIAYAGFCYNNNGELTISTDTNYIYKTYDLEVGKIYMAIVYNYSGLQGLVVADNEGNVVLDSGHNSPKTIQTIIFKVNQTNLKAYISRIAADETSTSWTAQNTGNIREITSISNNLKINNNVELIKEYEDKYINYQLNPIGNIPSLADLSNFNLKVYPMNKGVNYKVKSFNFSSLAGITLINTNQKIIYISSTQSVGNHYVDIERNFVSESDGFILLSETTGHLSNIEIISNIDINITNNYLKNKNIGIDGDSIAEGNENEGIGFGELLADKYSMILDNNAVGGATIVDKGSGRHCISTGVLNLSTDNDIIIIEGGVNDYTSQSNPSPLGNITNGFGSTLDDTTFYGALEVLARNLLDRFTTQRIYFLIIHKANQFSTNQNSLGLTFDDYYNAIINVMNKYSIPVIDLYKNSRFITYYNNYKNEYTCNQDGLHPNTDGYNTFYIPIIEKIITEL